MSRGCTAPREPAAKAGQCLAARPGDRELASGRIPPPQRSTPVPINHRDRSGREPRVFLVPEPPQKQILGQAVRSHASPETGAKQPVRLAFRQSGADGSHVFRPPFVLSGGWFLAHGYDLQRSESFWHRTTYCSTPDRRTQYLASRNLLATGHHNKNLVTWDPWPGRAIP